MRRTQTRQGRRLKLKPPSFRSRSAFGGSVGRTQFRPAKHTVDVPTPPKAMVQTVLEGCRRQGQRCKVSTPRPPLKQKKNTVDTPKKVSGVLRYGNPNRRTVHKARLKSTPLALWRETWEYYEQISHCVGCILTRFCFLFSSIESTNQLYLFMHLSPKAYD